MKKMLTSLLILSIFSFTGIGCVEPGKKHDAWQPVTPKKTSFVHMVQWSGETLPIIAKWYTGDSDNWQFLADANPNINPVTAATPTSPTARRRVTLGPALQQQWIHGPGRELGWLRADHPR